MSGIVVKKFSELNVDELYDILQLRNLVFAIEQNCIYPECDDYDKVSLHAMMHDSKGLYAYARILPPKTKYLQSSIGRVVVRKDWRDQGIAKILMQKSISEAKKHFPDDSLMVQAQAYLKDFYETLGFKAINAPYEDDGIPHIDMVMT